MTMTSTKTNSLQPTLWVQSIVSIGKRILQLNSGWVMMHQWSMLGYLAAWESFSIGFKKKGNSGAKQLCSMVSQWEVMLHAWKWSGRDWNWACFDGQSVASIVRSKQVQPTVDEVQNLLDHFQCLVIVYSYSASPCLSLRTCLSMQHVHKHACFMQAVSSRDCPSTQ